MIGKRWNPIGTFFDPPRRGTQGGASLSPGIDILRAEVNGDGLNYLYYLRYEDEYRQYNEE
jgi:hypothetical protein